MVSHLTAWGERGEGLGLATCHINNSKHQGGLVANQGIFHVVLFRNQSEASYLHIRFCQPKGGLLSTQKNRSHEIINGILDEQVTKYN